MKERNDYRTMVLSILGDASGHRYSAEVLDAGIGQALALLQEYMPFREQIRVKIIAYEAGLAVLQGLITPEDRIVTIKKLPSMELLNAEICPMEGRVCLRISGSRGRPAAGEMLLFGLESSHRIKNLDGAMGTTVPDALAPAVAEGAAGYCALIRARSVAEVFGKRPEDVRTLMEQGKALVASCKEKLGKSAGSVRYQDPPWPARGFSL